MHQTIGEFILGHMDLATLQITSKLSWTEYVIVTYLDNLNHLEKLLLTKDERHQNGTLHQANLKLKLNTLRMLEQSYII